MERARGSVQGSRLAARPIQIPPLIRRKFWVEVKDSNGLRRFDTRQEMASSCMPSTLARSGNLPGRNAGYQRLQFRGRM